MDAKLAPLSGTPPHVKIDITSIIELTSFTAIKQYA
jgi:hypothetical protein